LRIIIHKVNKILNLSFEDSGHGPLIISECTKSNGLSDLVLTRLR